MTEKLTIFSTVEDLRSCSNDVLVAGIDTVGKEVILAYILELRERLKQAELQTEFGTLAMPSAHAPVAPPYEIACGMDGPSDFMDDPGKVFNVKEAEAIGFGFREAPVMQYDEASCPYSAGNDLEQQVALIKSFKSAAKEFPVRFLNKTDEAIDLIWKDYDGKEVIVRQDLTPRHGCHLENTHFKHTFIAREAGSRKLRVFSNQRCDFSYVFEALNFGVSAKHGMDIILEKSLDKYYPEFPVYIPPDYETGEGEVAAAKSERQSLPVKVNFSNCTPQVIELIWKDHEGKEVKKAELKGYGSHKENTYFTHPFIAREKTSRKLRSFRHEGKSSFVFEAHSFGRKPGTKCTPQVDIRYLYDCING